MSSVLIWVQNKRKGTAVVQKLCGASNLVGHPYHLIPDVALAEPQRIDQLHQFFPSKAAERSTKPKQEGGLLLTPERGDEIWGMGYRDDENQGKGGAKTGVAGGKEKHHEPCVGLGLFSMSIAVSSSGKEGLCGQVRWQWGRGGGGEVGQESANGM